MVPTSGNVLQWIVVSMLGLAVVMVNSAGMGVGRDEAATIGSILTGRPVIYAAIAIIFMAIVGRVDIRRLFAARGVNNLIAWFTIAAIALCVLALIPGLGRNVNGSSRWLYIGPQSWNFSFQPSELAKWAVVLSLAWWAARRAGTMRHLMGGLFPAIGLLALVCGLVAIEDLGTAVLIAAVGGVMILAAGAQWKHMALAIPPAIIAVVAFIITSPYRVQRLTAFVDPWADPEGVGYHPIQSLLAISGGELTGRGLGNGLQKFGYLPEDTTDFVFAVVCEELGIAGAIMVVAMYLAFAWVSLGIIRECRHAFGRLLGLGVIAVVTLQALINLAVVTVVVPTKGIALPLISSGGTGWVATATGIGLLVAIDRLNRHERTEAGLDEDEPMPALSVSASQYA